MANDAAAPVNSVKKGSHAPLHTTRDKPPSVFFTFSKLIFLFLWLIPQGSGYF